MSTKKEGMPFLAFDLDEMSPEEIAKAMELVRQAEKEKSKKEDTEGGRDGGDE